MKITDKSNISCENRFILAAGAVRGDVVPGGSGLGKRFRGDVRQRQHKRRRSFQRAAEPGEDQIRPGPVAAAELGAKAVPAVRSRVHGAHAGATCAPPKESQRQRQRWWRRWRKIKTKLVFDIIRIRKRKHTSYTQTHINTHNNIL